MGTFSVGGEYEHMLYHVHSWNLLPHRLPQFPTQVFSGFSGMPIHGFPESPGITEILAMGTTL
jgi:hypothetical protein